MKTTRPWISSDDVGGRGFASSCRVPRASITSAAVVCAALAVHAAIAQDKIVLQKPGATSRVALPCYILDYTGQQITVRLKTGTGERSYPASEVIEVMTPHSVAHEEGVRLFARNQIPEATEQFEMALKQEARLWVRREILAHLIRCAVRQVDYVAAGMRFLLLVKSDPFTRHFRLIPLPWVATDAVANAASQAKAWLVNDSEIARLLGAGLLLQSDQFAQAASVELKRLRGSTDSRIRPLAAAQLWRQRLTAADLSDMELERWESRIREMPSDLRGGPYFLLGKGYWLRQDYERAAAAWLWLPAVYDDDFQLAARACCRAADSLARLGQNREATTLYQETVFRFPGTGFDGEADTRLNQLIKPRTQSTGGTGKDGN